jgi:4-fold beta flower protein
MEPIYDREGRVVAWRRGSYVYHLDGSHAGVIYGTYLYSRRGRHLGVFKNGLILDYRGGVVAFLKGASGGPELPHVLAVQSQGWGRQEWEQFINA